MAKALGDAKNESIRGFNCSRNIRKYYQAGGDQIDQYMDIVIGDNHVEKQVKVYDTTFMGRCIKRTLKKI